MCPPLKKCVEILSNLSKFKEEQISQTPTFNKSLAEMKFSLRFPYNA